MQRLLLSALSALLLGSCTDKTEQCERARGHWEAMVQRQIEEGLVAIEPSRQAERRVLAEEELAAMKGHFLEVCEAIPEPTFSCITRLPLQDAACNDQLQTLRRELEAALRAR